MIEVKISEVANSINALKDLRSKEFKSKVAFQLARITTEIDKELKNFNEVRLSLLNKYGLKDNEGNQVYNENREYIINPSMIDQFNKEANELLNMKIEINAEKIDIEDLGDLNITPEMMAQLLFLIK